jgi:calcineurin-like phosphoesterase family protein
VPGRTFAIGDIHGDLDALEVVLERLPQPTSEDTLVFMGDYVDRGPDSRGVIARVRALAGGTAKLVTLRGNHEDMWLECWNTPSLGFLLTHQNGCVNMYRSFTGGRPLEEDEEVPFEELERLCAVQSWLPADIHAWMGELALWYEDEHAIYVHAGVTPDGDGWKHPSASSAKPLMWNRAPEFFRSYSGKRLIFGHTPTRDLDPPSAEVWRRGDLVGIDTGAGKGGFLSALELPSLTVYDSRPCSL